MKESPEQSWRRIAAEARAGRPAASDAEAPAWFVTRVLAQRRAAYSENTDSVLDFPWLGRLALSSAALALAATVLLASTGAFEASEPSVFPEPDEWMMSS